MGKCNLCVVLGKNLNYSFQNHPMNYSRIELFLKDLERLKDKFEGKICLEKARKAKEQEVLLFHEKEYVEFVKRKSDEGFGFLDYGDTPAYKGIFEDACFVVGATLKALELILQEKCRFAFSPVGGLHHAYRNRASGFCVFNDIGVGIEYLRKRGIEKIFYMDIDAHHGDGVCYEYYNDENLIFADIHEDGRFLFPGTGFRNEIGGGKARGKKLNLPLMPNSGDYEFRQAFEEVKNFIKSEKFEFIILQCGADCLDNDLIAHLRYSEFVHEHTAKTLREIADSKNIPILAVGGGGYKAENVAGAWKKVIEVLSD